MHLAPCPPLAAPQGFPSSPEPITGASLTCGFGSEVARGSAFPTSPSQALLAATLGLCPSVVLKHSPVVAPPRGTSPAPRPRLHPPLSHSAPARLALGSINPREGPLCPAPAAPCPRQPQGLWRLMRPRHPSRSSPPSRLVSPASFIWVLAFPPFFSFVLLKMSVCPTLQRQVRVSLVGAVAGAAGGAGWGCWAQAGGGPAADTLPRPQT